MSRKMTKYSTALKTKLVIELLKEEKTLKEIAVENNISPKNLQNWKKIFLENNFRAKRLISKLLLPIKSLIYYF